MPSANLPMESADGLSHEAQVKNEAAAVSSVSAASDISVAEAVAASAEVEAAVEAALPEQTASAAPVQHKTADSNGYIWHWLLLGCVALAALMTVVKRKNKSEQGAEQPLFADGTSNGMPSVEAAQTPPMQKDADRPSAKPLAEAVGNTADMPATAELAGQTDTRPEPLFADGMQTAADTARHRLGAVPHPAEGLTVPLTAKYDLAQMYIELGDWEEARATLLELSEEADDRLLAEVHTLLGRLDNR
ncbi:hypothetical protein D0T90_06465 [Neisseria animalis]|uniref:Tetratricopeptide repeat protein n=2 Tax=Neisseria animalis TaxID=492 RepID=A0A5P3MTR5_NEIAN|nr:hypothetical protein D0T90_06465 [Neisseria animalis]ROW32259.1 hypothetical protein CGZ60_06525 [Neisseria animalis]